MTDPERATALLVLLLGLVVVSNTLIRAGLRRVHVPPMVGYILLGLGLRAVDQRLGFMTPAAGTGFRFLAGVGVVVLLFRIGLESNLSALLAQLRRASRIWISDVLVSGALGFFAARAALGFDLIPSLFTGAALSATSVGVSAEIWNAAKALRSRTGVLLIDVAELDDISGIFLMSLVFALVPALRMGREDTLGCTLAAQGGLLVLKFTAFGAFCYVFSKYLERGLTGWFMRIDPGMGAMLLVVGVGLLISALAGELGLSLAIGAMFAGLGFSRDPAEARLDRAIAPLFYFFSPFFFVGIGLAIDLSSIAQAVGLGVALLAAAVAGKVAGAGLPTALSMGWGSGVLLGFSMMPRAEIALIIMQHGRALGDWAMPRALFGGMVFVSLATCLLTPIVVTALLRRVSPGQVAGS